jgi:hypothetical protein
MSVQDKVARQRPRYNSLGSRAMRIVSRGEPIVGNMALTPGLFPEIHGADRTELATAGGMPPSSKALMDATIKAAEKKLQTKGKLADFKELPQMESDAGRTNIRNVQSKHWTHWLAVENPLRGAVQLVRRV